MTRAAPPPRPVRADARALAPGPPAAPGSLRPAAAAAAREAAAASRSDPVWAAVPEERAPACAHAAALTSPGRAA